MVFLGDQHYRPLASKWGSHGHSSAKQFAGASHPFWDSHRWSRKGAGESERVCGVLMPMTTQMNPGTRLSSERATVPEGKYTIELFKKGGEGAGLEEILDQHDDLTIARAIYRGRAADHALRSRSGAGEKRSAGDDAVVHRRFASCSPNIPNISFNAPYGST